MIMSGCAAFAQVVDPTRVEAELLPQWWEQVIMLLRLPWQMVIGNCASGIWAYRILRTTKQ